MTQDRRLVLGLDPGLERTGFAFLRVEAGHLALVEYGLVRTLAKDSLARRLTVLRRDLSELLKRHAPQSAAVESLFFSKNVSTALPVAHARGVLLQMLDECGIAYFEYTPSQVKKSVVGHGRADKNQMMLMCARRLGRTQPFTQDDASDAVALALVQAYRKE